MSLKRTQIFDAIKIAGNEADNVFDRAFGAYNVEVQRKIQENTEHRLKPVEITVMDTLELSRFTNSDIQPAGFHRSLSSFVDISLSNHASPTNSFEITPSLLLSNTINDFKDSPQTATPHLYTGKETGITGSQNISGGHQRHGQGDSSEIPRQLYLKLREMKYSPSPSTLNHQTPTSIKLSPLLSPTNLLSTVNALEEAPIIDGSGQKIRTPERQCKNVLHTRKVNRTSPKARRRSRKVRVQTEREVAAKREGYLLRNRQAANKCREKKKTWVSELLKREEFFIRNNAKLPYEIEQTMLELRSLRAIAVEHYRVCPILNPELAVWFEEEVVRLQHSKVSALILHNQSLTPPHQDANYTS
jgi:bZIP transcription factor